MKLQKSYPYRGPFVKTAFCVRKGNETFEKRAQELNSSYEENIDHRFWTEKRMRI